MENFFYFNSKNKKMIKYLNIFYEINDIDINKDRFNSIIDFLTKKSDDKLNKSYFKYFADDLLSCLRNLKINKNDFDYYLFKYIKASKIQDKNLIKNILKSKTTVINVLNESQNKEKNEVEKFISNNKILEESNNKVIKSKIQF
tara:strand:+ start:19588 stop:20019 length:432 start_codon:yes stop_codon:yes gene_type:complete